MSDGPIPRLASREVLASNCANYILTVSKQPGYTGRYFGGETNLAASYLDLRAEREALRADDAMVERALAVMYRAYGGRVLFSKRHIRDALTAALSEAP